MRQETKENLANAIYPVVMLGVFSSLEYFGVGSSLREFHTDKLEFTKEFYGSWNPAYWTEYLNAYIRPAGLEIAASFAVGGLLASAIAEPIKKIINRRK